MKSLASIINLIKQPYNFFIVLSPSFSSFFVVDHKAPDLTLLPSCFMPHPYWLHSRIFKWAHHNTNNHVYPSTSFDVLSQVDLSEMQNWTYWLYECISRYFDWINTSLADRSYFKSLVLDWKPVFHTAVCFTTCKELDMWHVISTCQIWPMWS